MPRNGSGVYSLPSGSLVTDGQAGTASQHNTPLNDLVDDANSARPIVAGGTAATTAADARTNLDVAQKQSSVTDTTAGRGLIVGAFGLGQTASAPLLTNLDATDTASGNYRVTLAGTTGTWPTSAPLSGSAVNGIVIVRRYDGNVFEQFLSPDLSTSPVYRRFRTGGAFTAWAPDGLTLGDFGYVSGEGVGGEVTQATSKSTAVTLNKRCGQITTAADSLAAGALATFRVTNSFVGATDAIVLTLDTGTTNYRVWAFRATAGTFDVAIENRSAGALAEALVLSFAVIKTPVT